MKEQIEKKIGCSLDEYIEDFKKKMTEIRENQMETEEAYPHWDLTEEEINFFSDYYKSKIECEQTDYVVDDRLSYTDWIKDLVDNMTDEQYTEYLKKHTKRPQASDSVS